MNSRIRAAVMRGDIIIKTHTLKEGERLDVLSYLFYNDSSLWWIIAAASGIGWNLQVPPGTLLQIPTKLESVMRYLR